LLASEQGASTGCIASFALKQGAVTANLTGSVFGEFGFVSLGRVRFVTQSSCLWISIGHHGLGLRRRCQSSHTRGGDCLQHENATIGWSRERVHHFNLKLKNPRTCWMLNAKRVQTDMHKPL
jgi:hypothetical protein